ncbi:MAG: phosphoribosylanthranilate isomerase [Bacillota bacterium]
MPLMRDAGMDNLIIPAHTARVKICGFQDLETAKAAADAGADAIGFVFAPSRRRITPETAREIIAKLPPFVTTVGVFVNEQVKTVREVAAFCHLDAVQLHGAEPPDYCRRLGLRVIKAFGVRRETVQDGTGPDLSVVSGEDFRAFDAYPVNAILLDTYIPGKTGGTGESFDWKVLAGKRFPAPFILAGGLNPENVAAAVRSVRPYAVDVSSGVETDGRKDKAKVLQFIAQAKGRA